MRRNAFEWWLGLGLVVGLIPPCAVPAKAIRGSSLQSSAPNEKIEKLLTVIRDARLQQSDPGRVVEAIQKLGQTKAVGAVGDLVQLLTFKRTWNWEMAYGAENEIHLITPASRYPAVGALMDIGQPALPALVKVIETHDPSSLESQNALEVIIFLFRDSRELGVDNLKEAAGKSSSPKGAQRLMKAADTLSKRLMPAPSRDGAAVTSPSHRALSN